MNPKSETIVAGPAQAQQKEAYQLRYEAIVRKGEEMAAGIQPFDAGRKEDLTLVADLIYVYDSPDFHGDLHRRAADIVKKLASQSPAVKALVIDDARAYRNEMIMCSDSFPHFSSEDVLNEMHELNQI